MRLGLAEERIRGLLEAEVVNVVGRSVDLAAMDRRAVPARALLPLVRWHSGFVPLLRRSVSGTE